MDDISFCKRRAVLPRREKYMRIERKQACELTTGMRIIVPTEYEVVAVTRVCLFGERTYISYNGSSGNDAVSYPREKAVQVVKEG
jgi:hypothetical protein